MKSRLAIPIGVLDNTDRKVTMIAEIDGRDSVVQLATSSGNQV